MGIEFKGTSPIINGKQKHPTKDFPEEESVAAAAAAAKKEKKEMDLGPGKLKQRPFKKGGKVK